MKINADSYSKINLVVLTFAMISILIDTSLSFLQGSYSGNWWLGGSGIILLLITIYRGPSRFKYDTEGEVMNLSTEDNLWGKVFRTYNKHYEFPKRKLKGYRIEGWFLRRKLVIFINSKTGRTKERSLLISYLNASQLKSLRNSLNKYSQQAKHGGRRKRTTEQSAASIGE